MSTDSKSTATTAIVAIVAVLAILAGVAFFFLGSGADAPASQDIQIEVEAPEMPDVDLPEVEAPEMPDVDLPEAE